MSTEPPDDVVLYYDAQYDAITVVMPRKGRMGDRRLIDGATGHPVHIGPDYWGSGEFPDIDSALRHFQRVADAFERLL